MARGMYSAVVTLLMPAALVRLWLRGRRQPAYRKHWAERFGWYAEAAAGPFIWVHAVSVGETHAAQPLIRGLRERYPAYRILLTHMTPTGRDAGKLLFGDTVTQVYLPYDLPWTIRAFLQHFKPAVGVLMETEIWFNLAATCRIAGLPLFLVNARLSERSARGYARVGQLTAEALRNLTAIGAQSAADAGRLEALGATAVNVTGNLKFDSGNMPAAQELGRTFRARFGDTRPVFLAASTRDGEEDILIDALASIAVPDLLCVIVPRHPQRFEEVATLLQRREIPFQRRSVAGAVEPATRVVLGDSMGEMTAYYVACDLAFVGGSLLPLGGQNLIEACALGRAVLIGPHTFNFSDAAESAVQAGAALRVQNAASLAGSVNALFADRERLRRMGEAGMTFCASHRGATARTLDLIARALP
jgi:3-deoxy-D-manno-octulosonic-acid transferase